MNKIKVEKDNFSLELENTDYIIEIEKECKIKIIENKDITSNISFLIKNSKVDISLEIRENSNIVINSLGFDSSVNFDIFADRNSNLKIVDSIITKIDSINNITINQKGDYSSVLVYSNGINLGSNKLYFKMDGIIEKTRFGVYLDENSKIINCMDGDSKIIPNLIIDTKEVVANHSAYLGTFQDSDLYYLMSRGINLNDAKNLLIKSYLLSNMTLNLEEFIKEISLYRNGGIE